MLINCFYYPSKVFVLSMVDRLQGKITTSETSNTPSSSLPSNKQARVMPTNTEKFIYIENFIGTLNI